MSGPFAGLSLFSAQAEFQIKELQEHLTEYRVQPMENQWWAIGTHKKPYKCENLSDSDVIVHQSASLRATCRRSVCLLH